MVWYRACYACGPSKREGFEGRFTPLRTHLRLPALRKRKRNAMDKATRRNINRLQSLRNKEAYAQTQLRKNRSRLREIQQEIAELLEALGDDA